LWGLGTSIGELPPYFVARAASLAGRKHEELEEMVDESKLGGAHHETTTMDKLKVWLYHTLKKARLYYSLIMCFNTKSLV